MWHFIRNTLRNSALYVEYQIHETVAHSIKLRLRIYSIYLDLHFVACSELFGICIEVDPKMKRKLWKDLIEGLLLCACIVARL